MSFGAIYDKFDSAIRWLGYLDWCWWGFMNVLVQNFFDCFYWWWSMIVPAGCCNSVSFATKYWSPNTLSQNLERVGRRSLSLFEFGVQIVCSRPTWVSLMNHLFTTSTHDVAGVFFELISQPENWTHVFLLLHGMLGSLWQLLCKNLATFTQNTQNLQPLLLIKNYPSQCKSNPRWGWGLPFQGVCSKMVGNHQTSKGITNPGVVP